MQRFAVLSLLIVSGLVFSPRGRAEAQDAQAGRPFWISTPPRVADLIAGAKVLLNKGDTRAAVRSLQQLLDDRSGDRLDFAFLARGPRSDDRPKSHFDGARSAAIRLLLSAGSAGLKIYEQEFGPTAQRELLKALADSTGDGLLEIARRYEPSLAGRHAVLAMVDRALLRGRPAEARLLLSRLRRLHAVAFSKADVRARLVEAVARDIARGGPQATGSEILAGVKPTPLPPRDAWPMMGGNAARNGVADAISLHPVQYELDFKQNIQERQNDRQQNPSRWSRLRRSSRQPDWNDLWDKYNPLHPVIARGSLIVCDGPQIKAYNLFNGDLHWAYPRRPDAPPRGRTNLATLFTPVASDGVVYGAVEVRVPYDSQELQGVPITYYLPERRLCAIDLDTGALLWAHDETGLDDAPKGKEGGKLRLSSAPLVRGERIYVTAARSSGTFENWLVALERRTGKLIYTTRISDGQQELNLFGRQLQEAVSTPIAEKDGVLYVGTNMGIVAAVDALHGTPLWATAYPIIKIPSTFFWFEAPRRELRLDNAPPMVVGDTVLFTPSDGEAVLALDVRTGRKLWQRDWRSVGRGLKLRTIVGADAERVYLSGPGTAAAIWLIDDEARGARAGGIAWRSVLSLATAGIVEELGRGMLSTNGLWLPGEDHVFQIDPETGKTVAAHVREGGDQHRPVHLVSGAGVLITAARDRIGARFAIDEVLARAKQRATRYPDSADAQLQAADVYLAAGAIGDALEHYRLAVRKAEAAGESGKTKRGRRGVHRALLRRAAGLLDENFERAPDAFETAFRAAPDDETALQARLYLDELLQTGFVPAAAEWRLRNLRSIVRDFGAETIEDGRRSVRGTAMRRIADLLLAMGKTKAALETLHELLEYAPEGEDGRWADRRIRALLVERGRDVYAAYERRAVRLFRTALESNDLLAVERGLRLYSNAQSAVGAMLALAQRRLERGEASEAARTLQRFLAEHGRAEHAPRALALMVRALHDSGSHGLAYAALLRLKNRHATALVRRRDGAKVAARDFAAEWLKRDPYPSLARSTERNDLQSNLKLQFSASYASEDYVDIPRLTGQRPDVLRDTVLLRIGRDILVIDAKSGQESFRLKLGLGEPKGPLVLTGDRLHAVTDRFIHAFDLTARSAMPRVRIPNYGQAGRLFTHRSQVFLRYLERRYRGRPGIAALNPKDGSVLWSNLFHVGRADPRTAEYEAVPHDDRIVLIATHPVSVTAIDATSGAVANQIEIPGVDPGANLVRHHILPDGRVLLGLGTATRFDRWQFKHSYELVLVDPAAPTESAVLWRYKPDEKRHGNANRMLYALQVMDAYAVAVDRNRHAAVVDLETGNELAFRELRLGAPGERIEISQVRGRDDSVLYVQTGSHTRRSNQSRPSRLAAFQLPDLQRRYMVDLTEDGHETALLIDSQGVMGFKIQGRRRLIHPRVRLFDPTSARLVEEIAPAVDPVQFFTASVQGGLLIVTTSGGSVFGYAPR